MNVAEFITSINQFDLLIFLVLFGLFILGFIQGTVRRLLGIAAILFSFLVAANVREPLGGYLAHNWTQFEPSYAVMIGFLTVFVAMAVFLSLAIQMFYTKAPLFEKYSVVDEVVGGTLGVVQGLLLIGIMIVILDSAFEIPGVANRNEVAGLREVHDAYDGSTTAAMFRESLIPAPFAVLGPFIPDELRGFFPGKTSPTAT